MYNSIRRAHIEKLRGLGPPLSHSSPSQERMEKTYRLTEALRTNFSFRINMLLSIKMRLYFDFHGIYGPPRGAVAVMASSIVRESNDIGRVIYAFRITFC